MITTVGQLREALRDYPDFYAVAIGCPDEEYIDLIELTQERCTVFLETDFVADLREPSALCQAEARRALAAEEETLL